jgi:hypothetical protein
MPRPDPSGTAALQGPRSAVGQMTYHELFAVVEQLRLNPGPARVTAVAAANVWTIGPLDVDLRVTPLTSSSG